MGSEAIWGRSHLGDVAEDWKETWKPGDSEAQSVDHYSIPAFDQGRQPSQDRPADIKSNKRVVAPDAVLLSRLNPSTPRVWSPKLDPKRESVCSTEMMVLRPREGVDRGYLHYLCWSPHVSVALLERVSGTTGSHQRVSPRDVLSLPVPLPPIEEQRAIAEVLGALDDRIEHLSAEAGLYDMLMQTAYQQLEVEQAERLRLGDVVEINPRTPLMRGAVAPYFDMSSLPESGFLPDRPARRPYGSGTRFVAGDVLLARITPCLENGKTGIVPPVDGEVAWGSTEFIVMRAGREVRGLVYGLSRNPDFRDYAVQHMSGSSGRQRVKADDIASYPVPDLASPTAARLGALAADWIEAGMAIRDQIETVASLRDALLPRLLSQEVRIEDPARMLGAVA